MEELKSALILLAFLGAICLFVFGGLVHPKSKEKDSQLLYEGILKGVLRPRVLILSSDDPRFRNQGTVVFKDKQVEVDNFEGLFKNCDPDKFIGRNVGLYLRNGTPRLELISD